MALRGTTPRMFTLSLRSQPERGGPVRATMNDKNGLAGDNEWRHLLVLVHGFNNSESEAEGKYEHYVDMLRPDLRKSRVAPDAVAKLHWPGNEAVGPFSIFDFAGYPVDVERALQAVKPLVMYFLRLIMARPGARQISFVGHSLGCRLIVEAMSRLVAQNLSVRPLAVVSLMAAAVPVALAENKEPLADAPRAAAKVIKAYSHSDWVLWLAFPAGQALARLGGIEDAVYIKAIGRNGDPSGFGISMPREGNGHSDYWTDKFAAKALLLEMDATLRPLPPPAVIHAHKMPPPAGGVAARHLKARELPP